MPLRYFVIVFLAALAVSGQVAGVGGRGGRGGANVGPQAPPPPSDCAASGTVVNSLTGEPIPHAQVTLGGSDSSGSATDGTGHWSIKNVVCGQRNPMAQHAGFIPQNQIPSGPQRSTAIQLVSGSPVTGVKIPLVPEASIIGTVRDADGDPLFAVQIRTLRVMVRNGERMLANANGTMVDSNGTFRIGRLTPGRYIVCAESEERVFPIGGGEPLVYQESCFPGPASIGPSGAMAVEAGREVRTAFTLTPMRGAHIRGSVSGLPVAAGPPLTQVQLVSTNGNGGRSAPVSADGTFDIPSVPPGSYVARVNFRQVAGKPVPSAGAAVDVGSSDVNNVLIVAHPPGSLSGTVRFELSGGASSGSSSSSPNPVVNVNLSPPPGNNFLFNGSIPQAKWDAGHQGFQFIDAPFGEFRLNVNLNFPNNTGGPNGAGGIGGGIDAYVKSVTLRGQDVMNRTFTTDGDTGPVEIVISNNVGSLDATVSGADGGPVPGTVMLLSTTGRRVTLNAGDDGHATRKNIPAGEYKAWAFDNINTVPYADDQWMTQNAGVGERIIIGAAAPATVTLKRIAAPSE